MQIIGILWLTATFIFIGYAAAVAASDLFRKDET